MSIRRAVTDLSIPKKLMLIVGLFSFVTLLLLVLSDLGMEILSGTRAYVGGEGLWSKSQKEAVLLLNHYASSHDEKEYQDYLTALEIPLGDRQARLELEKATPDIQIAFSGFQKGGNHPQDIPVMIRFFRRFRHISYIDRAIGIWEQGDRDITDLRETGDDIHREIISHYPTLVRLQALLKRVQEIDAGLTPLENAFSSTLGEGARWTQNLLFTIMIFFTAMFLTLAVASAFLISRHLCGEIDQLRVGAARLANGDFEVAIQVDSQDEIGDLARTFKQMAAQRHHVEQLKDSYYAHVEAANQELETFSYSVSHDLRTPLRAIDGFSLELLENTKGQLNARNQEDLTRIRAATQRMAQLIDDLLELSRMSRSELKRSEIDLSAIVQETAQELQKSAPHRKVKWIIEPRLRVQADPHLLRIALQNLVQNAWKFTQQQANATIEFGVTTRRNKKSFFVRDNGVGFNMAYVGKLFKPFQRLHDAKDFPGTGIGLALVQRIIHRHGGTIDVEAEEHQGAAFYFTLAEPGEGISKGSFL